MGSRSFKVVGDQIRNDHTKMQRNLAARQKLYESSMKVLESNPTPENQAKLNQMKTFVRSQVEERLKGHPPYFTRFVTVSQVWFPVCLKPPPFSPPSKKNKNTNSVLNIIAMQGALLIAMLATSQMAPWGLGVKHEQKSVTLFDGTTGVQPVDVSED